VPSLQNIIKSVERLDSRLASRRYDADFKESEHPRDGSGEFTSSSGGGTKLKSKTKLLERRSEMGHKFHSVEVVRAGTKYEVNFKNGEPISITEKHRQKDVVGGGPNKTRSANFAWKQGGGDMYSNLKEVVEAARVHVKAGN
jgi:hypothetical protein